MAPTMVTGCASITTVWNKNGMAVSSPSRIYAGRALLLKKLACGQARNRICNPVRSGKINMKLSSGPVLTLFDSQEHPAHIVPLSAIQRLPRGQSIQAVFNPFSGSNYPPMTKKPKWWWRALSSLFYIMPIHQSWAYYAGAAFYLYPFLENFDDFICIFTDSFTLLPQWFPMAYSLVLYLGLIKNKGWPHFLRFHVMMGLLLEMAMQIIGTVSSWFPRSVYSGNLGRLFCLGVIFAYVFTILECMRCALTGKYPDVPFVSDAAYIQTNVHGY